MTKPAFFLATLGCKVNRYESQALREAWIRQGYREAPAPELAGLILINSCAVTARAVADVRNAVRRLGRAAPDAAVIVTGCAAQVLERELAALPGVTAVIPQSRKTDLLAFPHPARPGGAAAVQGPGAGAAPGVNTKEEARPGAKTNKQPQADAAPAYPAFALSGSDRSRAALKIQDGCSQHCAYCIVPLTRGRPRSRPFADTLAEARRLLDAGFREIVISGVNLRQYRESLAPDGRQGDFWNFLARLDAALAPAWAGRARLRLSSLEPGQLDERALLTLRSCGLVAPHLHLSLQSGSPAVLRRMGRGRYDPAALPAFLADLAGHWPLFALGADLLTAFPGESEAEFDEGLALVRSLPLTYAHVFPYSRRPGTRAADLPGQIPAALKKERAARLRALAAEKKAAFLRRLLALDSLHLALEDRGLQENGPRPGQDGARKKAQGQAPGALRGLCEYYVDCRLPAPPLSPPPGELLRVRPLRLAGTALQVEAAPCP